MRKTITVIAVLIVLVLIGVGIVQYVNTSDDSDFIGQPGEKPRNHRFNLIGALR